MRVCQRRNTGIYRNDGWIRRPDSPGRNLPWGNRLPTGRQMNRRDTYPIIILIISAIGFLSLAGPASAYDYMQMYATTDLLGGDYKVGPGDEMAAFIYSANPEECALMCLADTRCKAATFMIPNGRYGPVAKCWLKNSVPVKSYDVQTTSWIKIDYIPTVAVVEDKQGILSVVSSPSGATISVDGQAKGSTPLSGIKLSEGTHTVLLLMTGYEDYSREVTISRTIPVDLQVTLWKKVVETPSTGSIAVTTNPAGAGVSVDGTKKGKTPVTVTDLSAGQHTVSITKDGYAGYTTKVTITGGETLPLSINLVPLPGTTAEPTTQPAPEETTKTLPPPGFGMLNIQSNPQGALITLDGEPIGKTPTVIRNVDVGKHTIVLIISGYNTTSVQAEVYAGSTTDVSHDFGREKKTPGFNAVPAVTAVVLGCLAMIMRRKG